MHRQKHWQSGSLPKLPRRLSRSCAGARGVGAQKQQPGELRCDGYEFTWATKNTLIGDFLVTYATSIGKPHSLGITHDNP